MAAGAWILYNDFIFYEGEKLIDLSADVYKYALFIAGSSLANKAAVGAAYNTFAAAGGEVANGNGYTTGGYQVVASWTGGGDKNVADFVTTSPEWTATGAGLVARFALLYNDTAPGKLAVAYCQLGSADVTIPAGQKLKIQITKIFGDTQA